MTRSRDIDRRALLVSAGAVATALAAGSSAAASAGSEAGAKSSSQAASPIIIDSLGSLDDPNTADLDAPQALSVRVVQDARASGLTALNLTLGYIHGPGDPFEFTVRDIVKWDRRIAENPGTLRKVTAAGDIGSAHAAGQLGLIYGFQNEEALGERADRVDLFADMGVRVFQLTYNERNRLGGGSSAPEDTPLTAFGREVIDHINDRLVMVDLSHSGRQTCLDAAQHSRSPACISHTGCRALVDLPRNKSDQELRLIADRGGYVGIYFMPYLAIGRSITSDDVVRHIEHALQVCGEDGVGIGTDGSATGIDDLPAWEAAFRKQIEARRIAGISSPGETPYGFTFATDMYGREQFHILADKLAKRQIPQRRIEKIMGGNFLRYAQAIWGK
jgi:membrane dipeptidase